MYDIKFKAKYMHNDTLLEGSYYCYYVVCLFSTVQYQKRILQVSPQGDKKDEQEEGAEEVRHQALPEGNRIILSLWSK